MSSWNKVEGSFKSVSGKGLGISHSVRGAYLRLQLHCGAWSLRRWGGGQPRLTRSLSSYVRMPFIGPSRTVSQLSPHRGSNLARPVWQSRFHQPLSGLRSQYGLRGARMSGGDRRVYRTEAVITPSSYLTDH